MVGWAGGASGTVWGRGLTSTSLGGDEAPSGEVVSKVTGESWGTGLSPSGIWGAWRDWGVDQVLDMQRWGGQRAGAALCSPLLSPQGPPAILREAEEYCERPHEDPGQILWGICPQAKQMARWEWGSW